LITHNLMKIISSSTRNQVLALELTPRHNFLNNNSRYKTRVHLAPRSNTSLNTARLLVRL